MQKRMYRCNVWLLYEQAKNLDEEGKYEDALKNINYLNPYYDDDEN